MTLTLDLEHLQRIDCDVITLEQSAARRHLSSNDDCLF